jgi:hypothetical protein
MRLAVACLVVLACMSASSPSPAVSETAALDTRTASIINAFQVMCTLELPNFAHIEEKAIAMRMKRQVDKTEATPGNTSTRSTLWVGTLSSGPFVLLLDEMSGARGKSTSCAIAVNGAPDTDAFRAAAVKVMNLPTVPQPEMRSDGSRSFIWDGVFGKGTTFLVRDFKSLGKPGIMLKLIAMVGNS